MAWWAWATIGAVVLCFGLFIYSLANIAGLGDEAERRRMSIGGKR
jgi:hypothetical protein